MEAFATAYDWSRSGTDYVMSQLFDIANLTQSQAAFNSEYERKFKNVKFYLKLGVHEPGTAKGYDGRIIDIVQPYYQYADTYNHGKGWDKDPASMPTSANSGNVIRSGYPYALTIYGTYQNNDRMASLYFQNLSDFQLFLKYVKGK